MPDQANDWATLDELLGVEVAEESDVGLGPVAFYGRCSTEDNQDPETSLAWQLGNAQKFVEPLGGKVVAEFFDIGQSRSVPWERREAGAQLLAELKDPARGWGAVVVGEGTRCWLGNQFSLTAPKFAAYGVDLWVPELGGKFDQRNPSHKMLMSVLGGMSESERQHVQARVRAAMDAQVINEGRHQGGRAPFGYVVVDGGPHPNPRKAAEGYRLRVLAIDEEAAAVVSRIFDEYLEGKGLQGIATGLNRDGIPCPSARRPEQNRHRRGDGWQYRTVHAILDNPRYTGYAVFGRWTKTEKLLDPDDVAAGHVVRFKRSNPERIVRSRRPAHPAIVSVETFTEVQLRRRSRAGNGIRDRVKLERTTIAKGPYVLRGLVRCSLCGRKMQGGIIRKQVYYRCHAKELIPGSDVARHHPKSVNLRECHLLPPLNAWIGGLFHPDKVDDTVMRLASSQSGAASTGKARELLKKRIADAETKLRRHYAAIEAGVDPTALVVPINEAQSQRSAAMAELNNLRTPDVLSEQDIYGLVRELGDVGTALDRAEPDELSVLYQVLRLELEYLPEERVATATIAPRVGSRRVRGGT